MTIGHPVSQQLALFLQAVALGAVLGLVYDLFRVLRTLGGRLWGGMLDALFCIAAAASLFFFVMAGDGEMRFFVLLGAGGGMLLFLCLAGPVLRPVWRFWLSAALFPARMVKIFLRKCLRTTKKLFSFGRVRIIMVLKHIRRRRVRGGKPGEEEAAEKKQ